MKTKTVEDRLLGCFLGLALGDALGTTLEFKSPGSFSPINDMIGGGPFQLEAGQWTDDTSMALCLADSLLACRGMDLADQCERYLDWWKKGANSVTGHCFDIGNTVRTGLSNYQRDGNPQAGPEDSFSAGNGSIMRLAPVFLASQRLPLNEALARCEDSSLPTHQAPEAIWGCRLLGAYLRNAVTASHPAEVFALPPEVLTESERGGPISPALAAVAAGSFQKKMPPEIRGTGYVTQSLEAALWAFFHATDFRSGALLAVNLGDDADTTGAIYGQIAGAFWGANALPSDWLKRLAWREKITQLSLDLIALEDS